MVTSVSKVSPSIPVSTVAKSKAAKPEAEESSAKKDGNSSTQVTLSAAGQAAAAVAEATETAAQTAQEAAKGDMQAKRLEARQEAAKA